MTCVMMLKWNQSYRRSLAPRSSTRAPDAGLDIHARGFWARQGSTFFDVCLCHSNVESYKDLTPQQIYRQNENEKERQYSTGILEVEQAAFTPLVFATNTKGI